MTRKSSLYTASQDRENRQRPSSVALALTAVAWAVLATAAAWVIGAVGWVLLARLWRQELFIPQAALATVSTLALVAGWALTIFLGFRAWARYNYNRYYLKNKRKLEPMPLTAPRPGWAEAILTAQGAVLKRSRATLWRSQKDLRGVPAVHLLSEAAVLMREDDTRSAAGLLRIVVSDPGAKPAVRRSALRLLGACAARLGRAGREIAVGLRDAGVLHRETSPDTSEAR